MKIELKVYTTKEQRVFLNRVRRKALRFMQAVLPFAEAAAGLSLILLMCCMDSENIASVVKGLWVSGLIFCGSFLLKRSVDSEQRRLQHERRFMVLRGMRGRIA